MHIDAIALLQHKPDFKVAFHLSAECCRQCGVVGAFFRLPSPGNANSLFISIVISSMPTISPAWRIAISGLIALSVAMGIGRFAFTPLLPMMLHDGVVDLHSGGWLATANYIGYFFGALSCMMIRWQAVRMIRWGLAMTALLTLGMGVSMAAPFGGQLSGLEQPLCMLLRAQQHP